MLDVLLNQIRKVCK